MAYKLMQRESIMVGKASVTSDYYRRNDSAMTHSRCIPL